MVGSGHTPIPRPSRPLAESTLVSYSPVSIIGCASTQLWSGPSALREIRAAVRPARMVIDLDIPHHAECVEIVPSSRTPGQVAHDETARHLPHLAAPDSPQKQPATWYMRCQERLALQNCRQLVPEHRRSLRLETRPLPGTRVMAAGYPWPSPASRARMIACARSATCNLPKMFET